MLRNSLDAYARDRDAMQRVHRLAERYGRLPRDSFSARELVSDVLGDMLEGELRYDAAQAVGTQVEKYVQRRAGRMRDAEGQPRSRGPRKSRRSARYKPTFIPLDDAPPGAFAVEPPQGILDESQHDTFDPAELVPRIRERAMTDEAAQQLLAIYDRELYLRRDALDNGMTDWSYRVARERLIEYALEAMMACSSNAEQPRPPDPGGTAGSAAPPCGLIGPGDRSQRVQRLVGKLQRSRKRRSA